MHIFKISLPIICILLITISNTCYAQLPPVSATASKEITRPSVKNVSITRPYVSIDLFYSISLPKPTYSEVWIFQEGEIRIGVTGGAKDFIEQEFKDYVKLNNNNLLARVPGKVINETYNFNRNETESVTSFAFDSGKFGIRKLHLANERLYILFVSYDKQTDAGFFEKAFQTFKVVGDEEVKAELKQKIEDATPKNLPQIPVIKDYLPDLKEENLKGKVKTVVEESGIVSDNQSNNKKQISETVEFDKNGNYTKKIRYDYRNNPYEIKAYGYIDGKRVSKSGYLSYSYNPPPPAPLPSSEPPLPFDPRYTHSYEKKYINGKLSEEILYAGNGKILSRTVSVYNDNRIERSIFTPDGKLRQKYIYLLDENGQIVERTDFDNFTDKPTADRKYRYEYEYDTQGNWVKKTTSQEVTENGKTFFKPRFLYYRTITYYK